MTIRDFEAVCLYLDLDPAEVLGWVRRTPHTKESDAVAGKLDSLELSIVSQVDTYVDFLKSKGQDTPQP